MKPVPLNYSAPRTIFAGTFQFRTTRSIVGAIAFGVFGAGFICSGLFLDARWLGRLGLAGFGIGAMVVAAFLFYRWITRHEVAVRITEEGIESGRKIWAWHKISLIGGRSWGAEIALVMIPRRGLLRTLPTTPPLTAEQFERIMTLVETYLADHCPDVKVDHEIHPNSGGG